MKDLSGHLKNLAKTLGPKQLTVLVISFLAVVGVVGGSAYWMSAPDYTLLMADLDAESASAAVAKLKAAKVDYELTDGGRSIRVAAERVDEMRLQFASSGLPSAGRIGFEIFDKVSFGTTEFLEQVNYRRALEGELARTISTISDIASARVHIAMAKDSIFVEKDQPAKASVLLKLRNNAPLSPATVKGITGLVASAVESLRPEWVEVLDTQGRLLTQMATPNGDENSAASDLDRQQRIERDLRVRVVDLLEPVVGAGRVRVNVSARLKSDAENETEERWDQSPVLRSRQTSMESDARAGGGMTAGNLSAGGAAGARANLPPNLSTSPAPAATGPAAVSTSSTSTGMSRSSETANYEVSKTVRHRTSPSGQLERLSVAVILDADTSAAAATAAAAAPITPPADGAAPPPPAAPVAAPVVRGRTQEELQRIQQLVAAAVGFDEERGDLVTVESMPFDRQAEEVIPAPPAGMALVMEEVRLFVRNQGIATIRLLVIGLLAAIVIFGVLRPSIRKVLAMPAPAALPAGGAAPALPGHVPTVGEMQGRLEAGATDAPAGRRVAQLTGDEPERLARVMRGWMATGEKP